MITGLMRRLSKRLTFLSGLLLVTVVACTESSDSRASDATAPTDLARPAPTAVAVDEPLTYTIVSGDFLSEIASRFEVSLDELAALNGIQDPALIEVGAILTIPGQQVVVATIAAVATHPYEELYAVPPLPPAAPPPEPSRVQQLIDQVAGWPWPPRQDMVTGITIGAFALAALAGGFVMTKVEFATRRWGRRAVPTGARRAFGWWGAAARFPRRSYLAVRRNAITTWQFTAASRKATSRRYRWARATVRAGWARTAGPRRSVVRGVSSGFTRISTAAHTLIGTVLDRAPEAAEGLNAFGGRASSSVKRGVTSGAKRARREVLETSAPAERWRTPLAGELATAFEREQLQVRYVPVIDLDIHALSAVEAHLFWQHPRRGLMSERDIYAAAQDHPELGAALLEFLLEQSCSFLKEQVDPRFPSAQLIVPITLEQIVESEPLAAIDRGLTSANLAIDRLKVAISEADALQDPGTAASFSRNLRSMGLGVFLDHYGGASAADLSNLRVSSVTVDFAAASIGSEARGRLSAAVKSAQDLRLPVTARHARSEAAQSLQVELGCAFAAIGEPIPADAFVSAHVVERREATEERRAVGAPTPSSQIASAPGPASDAPVKARIDEPLLMTRPAIVREEIMRAGASRRTAEEDGQTDGEPTDSAEATGENPGGTDEQVVDATAPPSSREASRPVDAA